MSLRLHKLNINFTNQELYDEMDLFIRKSPTTLWSVETLSDHSVMYLWFVKIGTLKIIRAKVSSLGPFYYADTYWKSTSNTLSRAAIINSFKVTGARVWGYQLLISVIIPRITITSCRIHLTSILKTCLSAMLMFLRGSFTTIYWLCSLRYIVSDGQDGKPIPNIDLYSILWLERLLLQSLATSFYWKTYICLW